MSWFSDLGPSFHPWAWLVAGLALMVAETVLPGMFLIWFGIAALATGAINLAVAFGWQTNILLFAGLSFVSVVAGRLITRRMDERIGGSPHLNRRGEALVGRIFPLDGPLANGEGRIRIDDSVWRVLGPDLASGTRIRVVRVEGATLMVEPAG